MSAIEQANRQQLAASDPKVSAFVAASAGSGKTKLLTDRLLRLMLTGTAPDKILCLTYTKAAAAEMRIRLNRRLGEWVAMPSAGLRRALEMLGVTPDAKSLDRARQLFAIVLDLPGGMRIETIHAFCQSLLRRFPLEARLSPYFAVADDESAGQRLRGAREATLANENLRAAIEVLAAELDETRFAEKSQEFVRDATAALLKLEGAQRAERLREALQIEQDDEEALVKTLVSPPRESILRDYMRQVAEQGNDKGKNWAFAALDWLALPLNERIVHKDVWYFACLTKDRTPLKLHQFCGKKLKSIEETLKEEIVKEAERLNKIDEALNRLRLFKLNLALLEVLTPLARADQDTKALAAELSYNDLIRQTSGLLIDPGAAWVLYKLDGGIEHLLLDEVQDTAPAQWDIANAIAAEFFAGLGARETTRSIFAVGDPKQSIFSFQGADLRSFEAYRDKFRAAAQDAGQRWLDGALSVSFRSTEPVLALTDAVFAQGKVRAGVVDGNETLKHSISRVGQAGKVILWPLTQAMQGDEPPDWAVLETYQQAESAIALLARKIGDYIAQRLQEPLPSKDRLARPGDFLILVRRRGALVAAMMSELKARGIEVAGLDRMVLANQPAVLDMLALCDALLLPQDNLAFAQFLVSPLGGLSDESLMVLAINGQTSSLVATLYARAEERAEWREAKDFYAALRARVDYDTPFAILAEALGVWGGRAKLLARFGAEATEPLDEFLSEALQFATKEPASLQSFVQSVRLAQTTIKRDSESGGDEVRIMTVHGAKGLQAPIVIMPDTLSVPKSDTDLFWFDTPAPEIKIPVLCPRRELLVEPVSQQKNALHSAEIEEYNRLLYVALTRAEDEILVCGAQGGRDAPDSCWYGSVKSGFSRLATEMQEGGTLVYGCAQTAKPDGASKLTEKSSVILPAWSGQAPHWRAIPPVKDRAVPERIVPSRAVDEAVTGGAGVSPLVGGGTPARQRAAALVRGTMIHALLQYLPNLPEAKRHGAALAYLQAQAVLRSEAHEICDSVLKILHDPELAPLFGPGSYAEVPLAGVLHGREVSGEADRVFIGADEIIIADYKTNRNPPQKLADIPPEYLFQLSVYQAVLGQIYPGRRVRCLLIWTEGPQLMEVPQTWLETAGPG